LSPAPSLIILTPCVDLLLFGINEICVLITCAFSEITIKSSSLPIKTLDAFKLPVFPIGGAFSVYIQRSGIPFLQTVLYHAFLPSITIIISSLGSWILTMRNNMINVLAEDYITVALAKGLPLKRNKAVYAAKNAILPSLTGFAMSLGFVVGGGLLTEMVFGYPGVGLVLFQAVQAKDYALMQGIFLFISMAVLLANFFADIAILFLDPRVREGGK